VITSSDTIDRVRDLIVRPNGDVWVLSASPPFVAIFDSVGALRRAGGRVGRGPTDFLYPFLLVEQGQGGAETVGVLDLGRHELVQVDSSLAPSEARKLRVIGGVMRDDMPSLVASLPFAVAQSNETIIASSIPRGISTAVDLETQEIVQVREDGGRTIAKFKEPSSGQYRWLRSYALWHACGNGSLVGIDPTHRILLRVDSSGDVDSTNISLARDRKPLTEAAVKSNLRHHIELEQLYRGVHPSPTFLDSAANRAFKGVVISERDSLPIFSAIICSESGAPWLQVFDMGSSPVGAGRLWWRSTSSGWERVILPYGFRPFRATGDKLFGVSTETNGVERIASASPRR